jgi:NAD+ diphosphatase
MIHLPDPFPAFDWSSANTFSANALDRCSNLRTDPSFVARSFEDPRARLMLFYGDRVLVTDGDPPRPYLTGDALDAAADAATASIFLGVDPDGVPWFAADVIEAPSPALVASLVDLRTLALEGRAEPSVFGPAAQARAMLFWHHRNRFCGACGHPTELAAAGYQRNCPACGTQHFPRTDPVVIMLIADGDRALLGRQARFTPNMYTCLAGFMEPGETVEDAVRREVAEESGIRVGAIRYLASQPWPFPSNLMLGCLGEALSADITIDHNELEDCRWFDRDEVRAMLAGDHPAGLMTPMRIAIARSLIGAWVAG